MATPEEVGAVIDRMLAAGLKPAPKDLGKTVMIFFEHLSEYALDDLRRACDEWIHASRFFPTVSELLQTVERCIAWRLQFYQPQENPGTLRARQFALEDACYHQGRLDEQAWLQLIADYTRFNRPHGKRHARLQFEASRRMLPRVRELVEHMGKPQLREPKQG